jgi:hypothetical protein
VALHELDQAKLTAFFRATEPFRSAYRHSVFQYIAIKHAGDFVITHARLRLKITPVQTPNGHFQSLNLRAGQYALSELGGDPQKIIAQLLDGKLETPGGTLAFRTQSNGGYGVSYTPFHPEGLSTQARLGVVSLVGGTIESVVGNSQDLEWELKASDTPYQDLSDLMFQYGLGQFTVNALQGTTVDVIGETVAWIHATSTISGKTARIVINLAQGLDVPKSRVGYRVIVRQQTMTRSFIPGDRFAWELTPDGFNTGTYELTVPETAAVQCIISYAGVGQHYYFLFDLAHVPNPLRAAYEAYDDKLQRLTQIINSAQGRGYEARDLESAIGWLLWMHGFQVAQIGATRQTHIEGPDLIAMTPTGHFAVVECTSGLLGADKKMANLVDRAAVLRRRLDGLGLQHREVLKVMATSKRADEVAAERPDAERLGVLVLTREDLDQLVINSVGLPNAERLYSGALESVRPKVQPVLPGLAVE